MLGRTGVAHYGRRCLWAHLGEVPTPTKSEFQEEKYKLMYEKCTHFSEGCTLVFGFQSPFQSGKTP